MEQGHTWTGTPQGARQIGGVAQLRGALFERGVGDDGHIAQHQEPIHLGQRDDGGVGDDGPRGTKAILLVENVAQKVVAVHQPLHEHIGRAVVHQLHGALHGFCGIGSRQALHLGTHRGRGLHEHGGIVFAHQEGMDKTEPHTFEHGLQRVGVGGTTHGDPHTAAVGTEPGTQGGKRTNELGHGEKGDGPLRGNGLALPTARGGDQRLFTPANLNRFVPSAQTCGAFFAQKGNLWAKAPHFCMRLSSAKRHAVQP